MKGAGKLKFAVADIREQGGLAVSVEVAPETLFSGAAAGRRTQAALPHDAKPDGPLAAELEFSVGGNRILLQMRLSGRWRVSCSRCLALHSVAFSASSEETYPVSLETIDVAEELRQAAVLEAPQRSLCRADCKGICSQCGKDLNEGRCGCAQRPPSSFNALKKLKER